MPVRERTPSAEELETLQQCRSINEAIGQLNSSYGTIRRWMQQYGVTLANGATTGPNGRPPAREPITRGELPRTNAWDLPGHVSLDSGVWSVLEDLQRELQSIDEEDDEITVRIDDELPVLISWLADAHIGHTGTDMTKLRSDLETIRNVEGFYTILGGDLIDNVVTRVAARGMGHEQLTPVRVQKALVEDAVKYLGPENVLAMIIGNHEAWSRDSDDFDPIQYLARKIGCSYLGAFGFVNVALGEQTYRILAAHQFRMRSSFNVTHQAKRLEDFVGDADIVFTGHTHQSGAETTHRRQELKFYGQAGSYLTAGSRYSKNLGFPRTHAMMPGVILFPDSHEVIGLHDAFRHGPTMLAAFRERYARGEGLHAAAA